MKRPRTETLVLAYMQPIRKARYDDYISRYILIYQQFEQLRNHISTLIKLIMN